MFQGFEQNVDQAKKHLPRIFTAITDVDLTPMEQNRVHQLKLRIDLALQVFHNLDLGESFAELSGILAKQLGRGIIPEDPTLQRISDRLATNIATLNQPIQGPSHPILLVDELDIINANTWNEEVKNLRAFLKRMPPPSMPMAFTPPSRFRTITPGKEKDFDYWRRILKTFWNTSQMEETHYNGIPVLIHQTGRPHSPLFFSQSEAGLLVIAGNKRALAAAIIHQEFDELPEA